ncbi:hypothetical protein GQX74_013100 [Glossina fuscipes]|nr:hypothetical protein GQX74_013100 [Glossina fuscipes]
MTIDNNAFRSLLNRTGTTCKIGNLNYQDLNDMKIEIGNVICSSGWDVFGFSEAWSNSRDSSFSNTSDLDDLINIFGGNLDLIHKIRNLDVRLLLIVTLGLIVVKRNAHLQPRRILRQLGFKDAESLSAGAAKVDAINYSFLNHQLKIDKNSSDLIDCYGLLYLRGINMPERLNKDLEALPIWNRVNLSHYGYFK